MKLSGTPEKHRTMRPKGTDGIADTVKSRSQAEEWLDQRSEISSTEKTEPISQQLLRNLDVLHTY